MMKLPEYSITTHEKFNCGETRLKPLLSCLHLKLLSRFFLRLPVRLVDTFLNWKRLAFPSPSLWPNFKASEISRKMWLTTKLSNDACWFSALGAFFIKFHLKFYQITKLLRKLFWCIKEAAKIWWWKKSEYLTVAMIQSRKLAVLAVHLIYARVCT